MSKYESVEKVKDDVIAPITNIDDFVKKIIDIDYIRSIDLVTNIAKLYSEEIDKENSKEYNQYMIAIDTLKKLDELDGEE